jgi:pimeloyl-ACP methyl ester carboxylesterase
VERFTLPPRPRFLRVAGRRLSYVDVGNGPAVLLVHGFAHSIHGWRKNIGPLANAGYRVMAIDLPGFGYSDAPRRVRLRTYTDTLRAWLDLHCIDRAYIVGNSMGGLITAAFAARAPNRVIAEVLADPAGFGQELHWALRLAGLAPLRPLLRRRVSPWQVRQGLRWVYANPRLIEDEEVEIISHLLSQPSVRRTALRIGRRSLSLRGRMRPAMGLGDLPRGIRVPTLVIWGDKDRVIPVSHARQVQAAIPDAELTIFENCGHTPMMEMPEAFNERVLRYLREHPSD